MLSVWRRPSAPIHADLRLEATRRILLCAARHIPPRYPRLCLISQYSPFNVEQGHNNHYSRLTNCSSCFGYLGISNQCNLLSNCKFKKTLRVLAQLFSQSKCCHEFLLLFLLKCRFFVDLYNLAVGCWWFVLGLWKLALFLAWSR